MKAAVSTTSCVVVPAVRATPAPAVSICRFEDPLLRLFALDRAAAILNRLAPERGVAIEHGLLTRQIEGAQRKVEGRNFDMRKRFEYDDVATTNVKVIYHQRNEILTSKDVSDLTRESAPTLSATWLTTHPT